jgi:putative membrane protein
MKIIIHWLLSALAVMIVAYLLPGVAVQSFFVALVVAVVLGFLNTVIRPILVILTLPINILTLGLFTLVINALLVMLAANIIPGFFVESFLTAVFFSIILWLVNSVLHLFEPRKDHSHEKSQEE